MRVGILGLGAIGAVHAAAWAETEAEFVGGFDPLPENAQAIAAKYGGRAYPDIESLLEDVDIVDICTPTHLHHSQVLQAAAAGKHIVCEKPLARTLEQGREMVAACNAAGVKLLVAHVVRFFPEYRRAKDAVDAGMIGEPAVIRLQRDVFQPRKAAGNWFVDFGKSGGMMLDLMIHDFDYARWVAGEVKTVFAKSIGTSGMEAGVDHGLAILTHHNGAISHIEGSWAYPPPTFRTKFEIAGSQGLIVHDSDATAPIQVFRHQQDEDSAEVPVPASPLLESPYTAEIRAFHRAIVEDSPVPVSAADGLAALQIALAAMESAQTGKPVTLEPLPEVGA
jgi:predicted dehydrogenase